jgi:hypothetical protein
MPSNSGWAPHSRAKALIPSVSIRRASASSSARRAVRSAGSAIPGLTPTRTSLLSRDPQAEGSVQRHPAAHRVAHERQRPFGEHPQVGVAGGERGRAAVREGAVSGEVRRQGAVACAERVADRLPAPARLGEPVEQDEVRGHDATR